MKNPSATPTVTGIRTIRFLLQCQFDYLQRVWNLPMPPLTQMGPPDESILEDDLMAVLAAQAAEFRALACHSSKEHEIRWS